MMTRNLSWLATAGFAASVIGCLGDRAADRTLTIYQLQSTDTHTGQFQIDASQLPRDAIAKRTDSGSEGMPVTSLTIDHKYPIRVVLVPVSADESTTEIRNSQKEQSGGIQ
jgi:hypothetical protein